MIKESHETPSTTGKVTGAMFKQVAITFPPSIKRYNGYKCTKCLKEFLGRYKQWHRDNCWKDRPRLVPHFSNEDYGWRRCNFCGEIGIRPFQENAHRKVCPA